MSGIRAPKWLLVAAILGIAALQTHSLWAYRGDHVDENELVHYAVAFFGGDFDPGWYGYGSLPMYFLWLIYSLIAMLLVVFGVFDSVDQYAQQLFYNGHFYVVARYLFSIIGVATVFIYAVIARKHKLPLSLIITYVAITISGNDAIYYSNHVRADTAVSLFVALALLFFIDTKSRLSVYALAVTIAAAIATKFSALTLIAFLPLALAIRCKTEDIRRIDVLGALAVLLVALWIFQPYTDYIEVFKSYFERGTQGHFSWDKPHHSTVWQRVQAIVSIVNTNIPTHALLLPLGLILHPLLLKQIWPALFLLALVTLPYLLSPEMTFYWFVPTIDLLRFLVLMGAYAIYIFLSTRIPDFPYRSLVAYLLVFVFALSILVPNIRHYNKYVKHLSAVTYSNRVLAEDWMHGTLLFEYPIVLDSIRNHAMPRVYDPSDIDASKLTSRAFHFARWQSHYMNRIFLDYLVDEYIPRFVDGMRYNALRSIRIDFPGNIGDEVTLEDLKLCRRGSRDCVAISKRKRLYNTRILKRGKDFVEFQILGPNPRFVAFRGLNLLADGSYEISFKPSGTMGNGAGRVTFVYAGDDRNTRNVVYKQNRTFRLPILSAQRAEMVVRARGAGKRGKERFGELLGTHFVTSPTIYNPFLKGDPQNLPEERANQLEELRGFYRFIVGHELVKKFSSGTGQHVEIYRIDD